MRQRSAFDLSAPRLSLPQRTSLLRSPWNQKYPYPWRDKYPWGDRASVEDAAWDDEDALPPSGWQRTTGALAAQAVSRSAVLTRPLGVPDSPSPADLSMIPAITLPLRALPQQHPSASASFAAVPRVLKLWLIGMAVFVVLAATLATAGGGKGIVQLFSAFHGDSPSAASVSMVGWPITQHVQPIIQADDDAGYDSQQQHDDWWDSVCSAASFTEVARAWGHTNATIGQVLDRLLAHDPPYISISGGLLDQAGWGWMAEAYGLKAQVGWNAYTFDSLVKQVTTSGMPMVIGMEGGSTADPWGHFVVVTGGDSNQVTIADSSLWRMTSLPRSFFSEPTYGIINDPIWWSGETVLLTPA